jgi:hypothetical protein
MDVLYDFMIDLLAHRQVGESTHVKIEAIWHKVRLIPPPDDIVEEDYEETVVAEDYDGEVTT